MLIQIFVDMVNLENKAVLASQLPAKKKKIKIKYAARMRQKHN